MRNWKHWVGGMALLAMVGCGGEEADTAEQAEPMAAAPETAPAVDLSSMTQTPTGLNLLDLVVGEGEEAVPGKSVAVHYTGWFLDGDKFDSSLDRGETFDFALGAGQVIAGWDQGVAGMRVGGKRRLVIGPDLAYGAAGRSGIPPNSTLVFDVELFGVGEG